MNCVLSTLRALRNHQGAGEELLSVLSVNAFKDTFPGLHLSPSAMERRLRGNFAIATTIMTLERDAFLQRNLRKDRNPGSRFPQACTHRSGRCYHLKHPSTPSPPDCPIICPTRFLSKTWLPRPGSLPQLAPNIQADVFLRLHAGQHNDAIAVDRARSTG